MILETQHLTIGYGSHVVQRGLDLRQRAGELVCMLGRNGCGKSTLLRTLASLQPVLGGDILLDKRSLLTTSSRERARLLSLVLTERLSMDNTTVEDVVAMGRYPYSSFTGNLSQSDHDEIDKALDGVGIIAKKKQFFNELSDGEKQRVLIAKALAQQTPVILLDEPTSHLDLNNRIKILTLLRRLAHEEEKCVIISTHELDLALQLADVIWLMTPHEGIEIGSPQQLVESGVFHAAFQDKEFSLTNENGRLRVVIKQEERGL